MAKRIKTMIIKSKTKAKTKTNWVENLKDNTGYAIQERSI